MCKKWQLSSYLVKKLYSEEHPKGLAIKDDASGDEASSDSV
jgi:hypothetical protein